MNKNNDSNNENIEVSNKKNIIEALKIITKISDKLNS